MSIKTRLLLYTVVLLGPALLFCPHAHAQENSSSSARSAESTDKSVPCTIANTSVADAGCENTKAVDVSPQGHLPLAVPHGRPSIGLVLEGGGALGLAHIGVLRWFEENHIPVDRLAGTSMGALVGGLYASGRSANDIQNIATSGVFSGIFTLEEAYSDVGYRRRQDRRELPQALSLGLKGGVSLRNAVLTDAGLNGWLRDQFNAYNSEGIAFDELPIPFRCVATDLNTLEPVVFQGGSMPLAIRASISIPGIFPPVSYHGHYLVDGGIMDNLPTDVVKNDLHADVVIAVHLSTSALTESDINSIVAILSRTFSSGVARTERAGKQLADVVLEAATDKFSSTDYSKAAQLVQAGYQAAEQHRTELMRYHLNDSDWAAYLAARRSHMRSAPGTLRQVKTEGGSRGAQATVALDVEPLEGKPIDSREITKALRHVQGNGSYSASFETFSAAQPRTVDATAAQAPDSGILVRLTETRNGPPFLLLGADLTATTSNVTRSSIDFRLIHQDLGGFGSELRADVRVGFLTQLSTEYYRQLTLSGFFLQPHLGIIRQPVYMWADQKRMSERFEQQAGGGLDFGRAFSRNMQLAFEWRMQALRWHLTAGEDSSTNLSGTAQTGTLHFTYDSAVSGAVSPSGLRLDITAGALFHGVSSENAPLVQIRMSKTHTFREKNIIGFRSEVDTYFRRNVADPLRFTLGGPLRLAASSIDEYRGTDDFLVRTGYLRRIAALPLGLGQGLYVTVGYEAGEIWSPEHPAFLRQDGITGVVAATPLGVLTIATSIGDAGRRKVFFTLGRLF